MKRIFLFIALLIAAKAFAADTVLKLAVAPNNPNSRAGFGILLGYLSEKTGEKFELTELGYDEMLPKLASGEIAFADLSSSSYATAKELYKDKIKYVATVAARNEKGELVPYYKGLFFVKGDSTYKSLFDLKGKSFAFVSKTSSSGYIYPLATLAGMGINPDEFFGSVTFAADHMKIFEGLKDGFFDCGVSNFDSYDKARVTYGDIFRIVAETAEIPSGAIVSSTSTDPKLIKKVQDALISIKPTDPVVNYPGFIYKGFLKKDGGFYEFIKKLLKRNS